MTTPLSAQDPAEFLKLNRLLRLSLGLGPVLFFGVSIFNHSMANPGQPMFDWNGAPHIAHQLAPLVLILGLFWVWFWRGRLRTAADNASRMNRSLLMCAGVEALALGSVVLFFLTRDPILAAWAAPAFFIAIFTDPR